MMNTKHLLWLALAALLLCTTGCPVEVNEGEGDGDDDPGTTAECPAAELATVRFFHAAGGTPVTRPDFGPSTTRNLNVVRVDKGNAVVTSLAAGRASLVQLCSNKDLVLNMRLVGAAENRLAQADELKIRLTPDANPKAFDASRTIVLAGIADALKEDKSPENPASTANPLRFIDVPDTFTAEGTQIQVVHASRKVVSPVNVDVNPDVMGAEIPGLDPAFVRYEVSGTRPTRGTTVAAPSAVAVVFEDPNDPMNAMKKTSFSITPRIPDGAKALAILFDTEVYDPKNPDPTKVSPAPVPRLFVTGDDPLLGQVAGGGVQF